MKIETMEETKLDAVTFQVPSPDGTMFVTVTEDRAGKPIAVFIHIGKAGAPIAAWSNALARMLTLALDHGATINDVLVELSNQTTDKIRLTQSGESIRSGVEGVCNALMQYKRAKFEEVRLTLGDMEAHRGPRLGS
jgi:acyl-CoA hydrolase